MTSTYTISQLSEEFGITTRAIRHYEDKGLLRPGRKGRMRVYSRKDRVRLKLILRGKRLGFPLGEIHEILEMFETERGGERQLDYLCRKINAERATLLRQLDDIQVTLKEMDEIEAQCKAQLKELRDS